MFYLIFYYITLYEVRQEFFNNMIPFNPPIGHFFSTSVNYSKTMWFGQNDSTNARFAKKIGYYVKNGNIFAIAG